MARTGVPSPISNPARALRSHDEATPQGSAKQAVLQYNSHLLAGVLCASTLVEHPRWFVSWTTQPLDQAVLAMMHDSEGISRVLNADMAAAA
jgi:hypothetical protein